jgi:endoglucanase
MTIMFGPILFRSLTVSAALLVALVVGSAPAGAQTPDPRGVSPAAPNPLLGQSFFVDLDRQPSARSYRTLRRKGRKAAAAQMWKIASQPKFQWFGRWNDSSGAIRAFIERAQHQQPGSIPLVTVLRHQGKSCHTDYDGGGAKEDARTRRWYRGFARGVGARRVVIAFEPDSLGTIDCLSRRSRFARVRLLRYGVDVLSKLPNATVYLEGGASDWEPAKRTAWQLRSIGIAKVRGFMLNATHYDWTADNVEHGLEISRLTGGKHFIVNTAENGRGPVHYRRWIDRSRHLWRTINIWCHPLRRGLGKSPTTATSNPKVDAYMWINRPGFSGGSCNGGPLPIGSWWPERALMFAKYQTAWESPPRGTKYGFAQHLSLRQLGG